MILKKPRWLSKMTRQAKRDNAATQPARPRVRRQLSADATAPSHPWSELAVRNDQIMRVPLNQEGSEYLNTPDVQIVGKKEAIADADGGRASFALKLNTVPDVWWRHRFAKGLEDPPEGINRSDLRVEIQDDTLLLLCMPTRLEAKYAFIKGTVARTNAEYQKEKETVRARVAERANAKRSPSGKTSIDQIRERWDRLQL